MEFPIILKYQIKSSKEDLGGKRETLALTGEDTKISFSEHFISIKGSTVNLFFARHQVGRFEAYYKV